MTRLVLVRHGETDWNRQGRWQGQSDTPLNDTGRAQAAAMAESQRGLPLAAIYSSDLRRATETAAALAAVSGAPIHRDPRLREISLGAWEGMLFDDIRRRDGDQLDRLRREPARGRAPGGESPAEVLNRVRAVLADIARDHPADRVAVVSHGLALAALKVHLLGLPLDLVWDHEPANATPEEYDLEAR